jgi:hypothetical protein
VAVAIDCDQPAPEVEDLWNLHMPWARSLPFVFYTDEEGQFLHGTSGGRSAVQLLGDLVQVAART